MPASTIVHRIAPVSHADRPAQAAVDQAPSQQAQGVLEAGEGAPATDKVPATQVQRPSAPVRAEELPIHKPRRPGRLVSTLDKLEDSLVLKADEFSSWLVTLGIGLLAFFIRLVNLDRPQGLVFDETYYAKDAYALLKVGYELNWPEGANDQIRAGNVDVFENTASYIVHPQLGKWLIAAGEQIFGMNSFGWRIGACVFGTILIMATIRMARRLGRSTLVGALAGIFLTFDGLTFVMSRIALLDIFQATFTVLAVACVVADRDWFRLKLASHIRTSGKANLDGHYGPLLLFRPWLLASGVLFGCAIGCKWNSLYVLAAMGITVLVYSFGSRRTAGARSDAWHAIWRDGPAAFVQMVIVAAVVYVATWWSYLTTEGGWGRDWGANNPDAWTTKVFGAPLASLWNYHKEIYKFHTGDWMAQQTHVYEAHPAGWLINARPIGIDAVNDIKPGVDGCSAVDGETCIRVISATGTPFLWWFAAAALIAGIVFWVFGRDWRFAVPIIAGLTPWLMWFPNADRPLFFFYAIMIIPFTATVLALVCGKILGPADAGQRRQIGAGIVGAIVVIVIANFWFIYPILTDQLMTRKAWQLRMWFNSWI